MSSKYYRYLALGDSYTIGEKVLPEQSWPNQLAMQLWSKGLRCLSPTIIAQTGWTTGDLLKALQLANLSGSFDLVTLLIGVNNQYQGLGVGAYRCELRLLLSRAISYADEDPTHVVALTIPDWGNTPFAENCNRAQISKEIGDFNKIISEEARLSGVYCLDITPKTRYMLSDLSLMAGDGLHPSSKMYAEWVELVCPIVCEILRRIC
jgi:lysophospholipase L1-like esterase